MVMNLRRVIVFSIGYSLLATAYLIPPNLDYLYWIVRFQVLSRLLNGFFEFLIFVVLSFFGGDTPLRMFLGLSLLGPIIGYTIIKLWQKGFEAKEKLFFGSLFHFGFGFLAVFLASMLVLPPSSTCNQYLSKTNQVKVVVYPETGIQPGAYYFFVSSNDNGESWQQIFVIHHKDIVDVPCHNLETTSGHTHWFWMEWEFAVTHDDGKTWHEWNPRKIWRTWQERTISSYGFIQNVTLEDDQFGVMEITPLLDSTESRQLFTHDGGLNWSEP